MKTWFWCPCCQRAFEGDVPEPKQRQPGIGRSAVGAAELLPVSCPFDGCRATARCIMAWATVRKWAQISYGTVLPQVPVSGRTYEMPPHKAPEAADETQAEGQAEA